MVERIMQMNIDTKDKYAIRTGFSALNCPKYHIYQVAPTEPSDPKKKNSAHNCTKYMKRFTGSTD